MWRRWLGVDRRHGANVLVAFGRVGLGVGELRNLKLVGVGEKHCWLFNDVKLSFQYLMHRFQLADVNHEFQRVGRYRG